MIRYFKCWKCGAETFTNDGKKPNAGCPQPMPFRTSGICGGSFTKEVQAKDLKYLEVQEANSTI